MCDTFHHHEPGICGGLSGTPISHQRVAILGAGGVKNCPVIAKTKDGDVIAIRSKCTLSLTFEHRLIAGAIADHFMGNLKATIESGQFSM